MPLLQLLCIQGKTKHRRKYHHSPEQNLSFFELKIRQQIKEWLVLFFYYYYYYHYYYYHYYYYYYKTILLPLHIVHSQLLKVLFNSHEIINSK